jgi:hypothetical protein
MWSHTFGLNELWSAKHHDWLASSQVESLRPSPIARWSYAAAAIGVMSLAAAVFPQDNPTSISEEAAASWARNCARQIASTVESAEERGDLVLNAAFDRMYVPIPGTTPRRYKTAYDSWADQAIEPILNEIIERHDGLVYVFLTDPNGYVPVAPAIKSIPQIPAPPSPKGILDTESEREVARMAEPELIRSVSITPEGVVREIAVPVIVRSRLWCVLRMAYFDR